MPDEVVDQGLRRPLADNAAGIATWLDARGLSRGGDLTRKRSPRLLPAKQQHEQQPRRTAADIGASTELITPDQT